MDQYALVKNLQSDSARKVRKALVFRTWHGSYLNLRNLELETVPLGLAEYCREAKVRRLDLTDNNLTELPSGLALQTLHHLDLGRNKLTTLPKDLLTNPKKLRHLDLSLNELTELPPWVENCTELTALYAGNNKLTELPDLSKLHKLTELNVSNNKLTELPEALGRLASLKRLNVSANRKLAFEGRFPLFLLDSPSLITLWGVKKFGSAAIRKAMEHFLGKTQSLAGTEERRRLFRIRMNLDLDEMTNAELATGLRANLPKLHAAAHAALMARSEKEPLTPSSSVSILGSVSFKKTEYKAAIQNFGATYSTHPKASTTHIVLGSSPKEKSLENLAATGLTFLTTEEASAFIPEQTPEKGFLEKPGASVDESIAQLDNINKLLWSDDPATIGMGINLVKSGGLPEGVLTAMFAVAKFNPDNKIRTKARNLLKKKAPESVKTVLASRDRLDLTGDKAEMTINNRLRRFATLCPLIDWFAIARYLHKRNRYGLSFILDKAPTETRLNLLRDFIDDKKHLDFRNLYTPGYAPNYDSQYSYYSPVPPPLYVYELGGEIESLNFSWCLFNNLGKGIEKLVNLKTLYLQGNMFTTFPKALLDLPNLEELHIGENAFDVFPGAIKQMKKLKVLNIQGNRAGDDSHIYNSLEIPQDIRDAISPCDVTDGLTTYQVRHNGYYV